MAEFDLCEMMMKLSDAVAEKDVDMLRVLYRDLRVVNSDLESAKSGFDLFKLLKGSGLLKLTDISILIETIDLTGLNHLKEIIEKYVPYPDVSVTRFSKYRQQVLYLGKRMSIEEIQKSCHVHGVNSESPWKLIQHLENMKILTEENIESFLTSLKPSERNEDFNKLLSDISDAVENRGKQYVDMLRVLYKDYVNVQADLWKAKSAFEIFKLLQEKTHLLPTDISILWETIKISGLEEDLKEIVERYESYPTDIAIRFSKYLQEVIEIGKRFSAKILQRACRLHSVSIPCGSNGWKILKILQEKDVISKSTISSFRDKLNTINDDESVPPMKLRRNQDKFTREYLKLRLRKLYEDVNIVTPAFWNESSTLDIKDVFTDLSLCQIKQKDGRSTSLPEVLGILKSTESCKMLVTGKGGMGKTTLLNYIAHNWATGTDNTFADKLLFLINIRDIHECKTVLDAIVEKINPKHFNQKIDIHEDPVRILETFITEHDDEIVILLDGLDELEQGAISPLSIFQNLELEKSRVILTSRPGKNIAEFDRNCDSHVQVNGFNPGSISSYISKYFSSRDKIDFGDRLIKKFNLHSMCYYGWGGDSKEAFELCSSPFLLLKICTIWEQKQHLPTDLSDLFKELICCILNQYMNRSGTNTTVSKFSRIPENYKCAILSLGKFMYENLKENKLSIDKCQLNKMMEGGMVDLALNPGFVYKDKPTAPDDLNEIYTPPHKLISEALAGYYISQEIDKFDDGEYEMIRSNEYLHMTRVFAIEFLGVNASKLLKPWLISNASNYCSLAQYFRFVKKEHRDIVLQDIDKDMSPEVKEQSRQMCETFRMVLGVTDDKHIPENSTEHLLQLMSRCYDLYECKPDNLAKMVVPMITKSNQLQIEDVCKRLVHSLIILDGLYGGHSSIHNSYFEYLAQWEDNKIDILTNEMDKFQFMYTTKRFNFSKPIVSKQTSLSCKFVIHLMKFSRELTFLTLNCVTGIVLNRVFSDLTENKETFNLEYLCLKGNDLSELNGQSLGDLFGIAPKLKELDVNHCNLSNTIIASVVKECENRQLILNLSTLIISHNRFEDTDGVSFANFVRLAPKLEYIDISSCNLKTKFLNNLWCECDRIGVYLSDHMFRLDGNRFGDIDGTSLAKLVRLSGLLFRWLDYDLSIGNIQGLVAYARGLSSRLKLPWRKLDLSGINLSTTDSETLACLLDISPNLYSLDMNKCHLCGSKVKDILAECLMIGVVVKDNMLCLIGNDLSGIDPESLSSLVNMIRIFNHSREGRRQRIYDKSDTENDAIFRWSDYSFSSNNLQGLIDCVSSIDTIFDTFTWASLDLSESDLAPISGETLACLVELSPQLKYLEMNKCSLSGRQINYFLDECDKRKITLKDKIMISVKQNDLSDIEDESLVRIVNLSRKSFKWSDYSLSVHKLQNLIAVSLSDLLWENLDLSNINLDSINVATLFDLFKMSPELRILNMSNCHLQSEVFDEVIEKFIENNVILKVTDLFLGNNDFQNLKAQTISCLPKCMPCLDKLDLSNCNICCNIMGCLPSSPPAMKSLTSIKLSGNDFNDLNRTMITTFSRFVPKLQHLQLSNCNLPVKTVQQLSKMSSQKNIPVTLTSIYLDGNDLSRLNWSLFAAQISSPNKLKILKLDGCHLTSRFLHDIAKVFSRNEVNMRLTDVFLNNNDMSNINTASLTLLLAAFPSLMRIYMDNCNLKSEDVRAIMQAFTNVGAKKLLRVFNTLRLSNNDLSDIDGSLLASLFSAVYSLCSPSLTSFIPQLVVLSFCQLNDGVLVDMADSWKVSTKSFRLMIDNNNIVDKTKIKERLGTIISDLDEF